MKTFSNRAIGINVGAGLIIAVAAVTFLQKSFSRPYVEVCATRYNRQITMRLDRDGVALPLPELQSVANGQDEGLLDNLSIAQFAEGPTKFAMSVKLANGTVAQRAATGTPGGISLPWIPSLLEQPQAACLSYSVYLPADFDFGGGGTLPGLFATINNGQYADTPHLGANLAWHAEGVPAMFVDSRMPDAQNNAVYSTYERHLPRGRWVRVDQEIVLNTPGQSDGAVRMWFDGQLETEIKAAELRLSPDVSIAGVAGDVFFGGSGTYGYARADSTIWLSPFELRWK